MKHIEDLGRTSELVFCDNCETTHVAKPRVHINTEEIPVAANEYICHSLMQLLRSKGVKINIPFFGITTNLKFIMEYYGSHSRITKNTPDISDITYPSWLYWFDKWIGRIDSSGDTNLLHVGKYAIPVDFSMCFHWACGARYNRKEVDDMNIVTLDAIEKAKDDNVKLIIQSLSNDEIWDCICDDNLRGSIPDSSLIAYWSGLCLRKKLL